MEHLLDYDPENAQETAASNRVFKTQLIFLIIESIFLAVFILGLFFKRQSWSPASTILAGSALGWMLVVFIKSFFAFTRTGNTRLGHFFVDLAAALFFMPFMLGVLFVTQSWPGGHLILKMGTGVFCLAYLLKIIPFAADQRYKPIRINVMMIMGLFAAIIIIMGLKEHARTISFGLAGDGSDLSNLRMAVDGGVSSTEVIIVKILLGLGAVGLFITSLMFRRKIAGLGVHYKEFNLLFVKAAFFILWILYTIFIQYNFSADNFGFF